MLFCLHWRGLCPGESIFDAERIQNGCLVPLIIKGCTWQIRCVVGDIIILNIP